MTAPYLGNFLEQNSNRNEFVLEKFSEETSIWASIYLGVFIKGGNGNEKKERPSPNNTGIFKQKSVKRDKGR